MIDFEYEYPKRIKLKDKEEIELTDDEIKDESSFAIVIPRAKIDPFDFYLCHNGFSDAFPAWPKGEKYGLSKVVRDPWEIHIRIFENGRIYPHVEVRRDYLEHLDTYYVRPVFFEIIDYVKAVTDAFGLLYVKKNQWVSSIETKVKMILRPPESRTEWKPIVYTAVFASSAFLLGWSLAKLLESLDKENDSDNSEKL